MKLLSILLILSSALMISCAENEHSNLANDFVNALNFDLGYDVEIVKTHTKQRNYLVVRDYDLGTLDAYDLTNYKKGDDVGTYIENYEGNFYYDLDFSHVEEDWYYVNGGFGTLYDPIYGYNSIYNGHYEVSYQDVYVHAPSGLLFSKVRMTSSDLVKAQELVDAVKVKKATRQLTVQFGLAPARAKEVASLALQLNNSDKATMTTYQYDQYSKAILGSTYSNIISAINSYTSGDDKALKSIYSKAAKINGTTINHVKKLSDLFIKN